MKLDLLNGIILKITCLAFGCSWCKSIWWSFPLSRWEYLEQTFKVYTDKELIVVEDLYKTFNNVLWADDQDGKTMNKDPIWSVYEDSVKELVDV